MYDFLWFSISYMGSDCYFGKYQGYASRFSKVPLKTLKTKVLRLHFCQFCNRISQYKWFFLLNTEYCLVYKMFKTINTRCWSRYNTGRLQNSHYMQKSEVWSFLWCLNDDDASFFHKYILLYHKKEEFFEITGLGRTDMSYIYIQIYKW